MDIKIHLNEAKIQSKVTNDKFGLFVAKKWKDYLNPYTPRDTGDLMGLNSEGYVELKPFQIHYHAEYATAVYMNSRGVIFNTRYSEYATDHWDIKAAQAGQLNKLYRAINTALREGKF